MHILLLIFLHLSIFLYLKPKIQLQISQLLFLLGFFKFCIHLNGGQVYCVIDNQEAFFNLSFFPFFPISISQSYVMHMENSINNISGTVSPMVLKFGINVYHDQLYCVLRDY